VLDNARFLNNVYVEGGVNINSGGLFARGLSRIFASSTTSTALTVGLRDGNGVFADSKLLSLEFNGSQKAYFDQQAGFFTSSSIYSGFLYPVDNNTYDIGSATTSWRDIYASGTFYGSIATSTFYGSIATSTFYGSWSTSTIDDIIIGGSTAAAGSFTTLNASSTVRVDGLLTFLSGGIATSTIDNIIIGGTTPAAATTTDFHASGQVKLGDGITDAITFTGRISSDILPITDNTYDLGAFGNAWNDIYASGTIYAGDTAVSSTAISMSASNPYHVSSSTANSGNDIYIQGKYAYVAGGGNDNFKIIDISDPTKPELMSTRAMDENTTSIFVQGNYAYVLIAHDLTDNDEDQLLVYDISNPSAPTFINILEFAGGLQNNDNAVDLYVSGGYAYIAHKSFLGGGEGQVDGAMIVIDVADPFNMTQVATVTDDSDKTLALAGANDIFIQGKYAYIASKQDDALAIFDISDPANPFQVASTTDNGTMALNGASHVYVSGRYAYVTAEDDGGVEIIDISDPTNPTHVSAIFDDGTTALTDPTGIYVSGKYAYITDGSGNGIEVLDISSSTAPVHAGVILDDASTALSAPQEIIVQGKYAYVISSDGLEILDIGGADLPSANIGDLAVSTLDVWDNAQIANSLYVGNGLNVGPGGIFAQGLSRIFASSSSSTALSVALRDGNGTFSDSKLLSLEFNGSQKAYFDQQAGFYTSSSIYTDFLFANDNNLYDIGSATSSWRDIYASGTFYGSIATSTFYGSIATSTFYGSWSTSTIDDIIIGGSTAAAGSFTYVSTTALSSRDGIFVGRTSTSSIYGSTTSTFGAGVSATYLNLTGTSATSTFANGIILSGGCILDAAGACITAAGGGANTALSNLASVAINSSLLPGTANSIDLGSYDYNWRDVYTSGTVYAGNTSVSSSIISMISGNPYHVASTTDDATKELLGAADIAIQGKYAYIIAEDDDGLEIMDISDPANPTSISSYSFTLEWPSSIEVVGNYAYVTFYDGNAFMVMDISDPANPKEVGRLTDSTETRLIYAWDVAIRGSYAYVISMEGAPNDSFEIIDISDPTNPTHVTSVLDDSTTGMNDVLDIFIQGNYAYIISDVEDGIGSLDIFDISDPANPRHMSSTTESGAMEMDAPQQIYVSGKYAYITAANSNSLEILDVSDPANPAHSGAVTDNATNNLMSPYGIYVSGDYAYIGITSAGDEGVSIIDISSSTAPYQIGSILDDSSTALNSPMEIAVVGRYAFVTNDGSTASGALEVLGLPGADLPTANIGNLAVSTLFIEDSGYVSDQFFVGNSLNVGGNFYANGPSQIFASSSTSTAFTVSLRDNVDSPGTSKILSLKFNGNEKVYFDQGGGLYTSGTIYANWSTSTIDNIPIGASTPSTGAFTTLSASGLFTPSGGISTSTIDNIIIGGTTPAAGTFTYVSTTALSAYDGLFVGRTSTSSIYGNGATSTFEGPISVAIGTIGTSTFSGGIEILNGCFEDQYGACITAGGTGANTSLSNLSSVAISASLVPGTPNSIDLGSYNYTWRDIYASGTIYGNLSTSTLDNVIIGGSTATMGYFTTLNASSSLYVDGVLSFPQGGIATSSIDDIIIGGITPTEGYFTFVST
ncbi:LVIVD repeat-containing protein, partial [Patescibacteria group bacterium]